MTETITHLEKTIAAFTIAARTADINWEDKPVAERWSNKEILGH